MKRVAIIGSGGAGKSTLARALGAKTGLPVVHLDRLYWQAGWVPVSTMDLRLAAADTVILDTPRLVCLWRVVKRRLRFHNRTRPDMTVGNLERLTEEFLRFVWRYPKQKPDLLEQLGRLEHAHVVHLRTSRDVRRFLEAAARTTA